MGIAINEAMGRIQDLDGMISTARTAEARAALQATKNQVEKDLRRAAALENGSMFETPEHAYERSSALAALEEKYRRY